MKQLRSASTLIAIASSAVLLAACGGGGGGTTAATTGSGSTTTAGTVTGFGSVIVDGVRIDDHAVLAGTEMEDGSIVPVALKLGQHVEIEHDDNLVASTVRVVSEAEGSVDKVDVAAGTLTILGQTVFINADPKLGPVTVFAAPYTSLADIKAGDVVEVHGLIKTDASGISSIQATRIEKKTPDSYERTSGTIANLSTSASTFKLGALLIDYASAKILPAGAVLADGEEVHVALPLGTVTGGTAVKAVVVKIKDHKEKGHHKGSELGGLIAAIDLANKTLTVDGITVDASAATFKQPGKTHADLSRNTYVVVKGVYDTAGVLKATTIILRGTDVESEGDVELHGTILNFVSSADFTLRDVHVDASTAKIDAASCAGVTTLANNLQVEVEGNLTSTGVVKATSVKCEQEHDGQSVIARAGVASNVDTTAQTLTLTGEKGALSVHWSSTTLFVQTAPATLDGKTLVAEGVMSNGVLQASTIALATP